MKLKHDSNKKELFLLFLNSTELKQNLTRFQSNKASP